MRLNAEDKNRAEARTGLRLKFEIRLSDQLWIESRTANIGDKIAKVGGALHTYFYVSDVGKIQIPQLQGLQYKDKTRDFHTFSQSKALVVQSEVDRVYLSPPEKVSLIDPGFGRELRLQTWENGH